jgi:glycosyltransferase involved in cell wall biosynthesis
MMGDHLDLAARIEALEQQLADAEAALERERSHTEVERRGRERALRSAERLRKAGKRKHSDSAAREVTRLRRELDKVYASNTWKAGRVVWSLGTAPRRLIESLRRQSATPAAPQSTAEDTAHGGKSASRVATCDTDYVLIEDTVMRRRYQDALDRRNFPDPASDRNLVMTVYTDDLDEGRGDVYVAIGLGRYLERLGYEVIYLPQERWYDQPDGTAVYLAMHDWVEPTRIPNDIVTVAWIRNRTDAWAQLSWLPVYDMVFCSSELTEERIRQVYPGRTAVLPVAVDAELFKPQGRDEDRRGVVTTQNNWGTERIAHQYLRSIEGDFPLAIYGQDRGIAPELQQYVRGPVSFFALPSLYSQAAIVVDDLLVENAPFGNTNLRVFEALACGAVVLTNQARGLDRIGLELAPVYRNAPQLADLIDTGLDAGDLRADVKLLRQTVLEQHTFEVRAVDLAGHLEQIRSTTAVSERTVPEIIGYYPDYRNSPYQEMMWSRLRNDGAIPIALQDDFDPGPLLESASAGKVFHLNWTAPILGPAQDEASQLARCRRFLEMLDAFRDAGVPTVWTVHNVLPHECPDPAAESQLRQQIADRIDLIHVMCERTIAEAAPHYVLPPSKVRVIPHPSYIDVYPNLIDPAAARYELGIDPDELVYLFFGQIRHYKGVDLLLDAFDGIYRSRPRSRLIVVGEPGRFPGRPEIEQRVRSHPGVISNLYPIAGEDIQLHMNAADVVVLPYREGLNSGVMMLAYSYARPVIVAATGCVPQQVDDTTGITFSWAEGSSVLRRAMLEGERLCDEAIRTAAYRKAQQRHYLDISSEFAGLVEEARSVAVARLERRQLPTDTTR